MFIKSAASDTNQGKAIQSVNEKWGEQTSRTWNGRETIGVQVCKKKYTPFLFSVETTDDDENDAESGNAANKTTSTTSGTVNDIRERKKIVKVVRVFGCPHHSNLRKEKIECYDVRKGWEPFGQWSLRKAQQLAKRETNRLNNKKKTEKNGDDCSSSEDNKQAARSSTSRSGGNNTVKINSDNEEVKTICHNGKCIWKMKEKFDNVCHEIRAYET
mmetsp:Transcript_6509/g.7527  ORF Transcript_6509/g.7527 Transcript_6509/m.7527 type:complete len:215 (+) Transcript_6509:372-1016(+)